MCARDGNRSPRHTFHQPLLHAVAAETEPRHRAAASGGDEHRLELVQLYSVSNIPYSQFHSVE